MMNLRVHRASACNVALRVHPRRQIKIIGLFPSSIIKRRTLRDFLFYFAFFFPVLLFFFFLIQKEKGRRTTSGRCCYYFLEANLSANLGFGAEDAAGIELVIVGRGSPISAVVPNKKGRVS